MLERPSPDSLKNPDASESVVDRSHAAHLRAFLPAVWKDGIARMSGGIGIILAFLAAYFAFIQNHSIAVLWLAALVACVFACYHVWRRQEITLGTRIHELSRRVNELEARSQPILKIEYRPEEGEPFVHCEEALTQYRVSVWSPAAVSDVELVVNHLKVGELPVLFDWHLRPMHDRDTASGTKRVAVKAGREKHWDLVCAKKAAGYRDRNRVYLTCIAALAGGSIELPPGDYEFELMATGGQRPDATKVVNLSIAEDYTIARLSLRDGRLSETFI